MWLPNAKRVNLGGNVGGGPYDDMRKPKVCWHMTQGSGLAGARSAFAAHPPHIGYDPKNRQLEQYVPLDRHSYAFFNGEADDEYIIQIEVVGFAEDAHNMPDWQVQNIVDDLVNPLEELIGVPPVVIRHGFRGAGEGIVLASPSSPIRISLNELREFSGHLGHQHIPGDGHWDPGRFRIGEVLRRSQGDDDMSWNDQIEVTKGDETWSDPASVVVGSMLGHVLTIKDMVADLADRVERLETSGVPVTAEVDWTAGARAINDEDDRRDRDDDPSTGARS